MNKHLKGEVTTLAVDGDEFELHKSCTSWKAFGQVLAETETIEILAMGHLCFADVNIVKAITVGLKENSTLRILSFDSMDFGEYPNEVLVLLIEAILEQEGLERVCFINCKLTDKELYLFRFLQYSETLSILDLSHNDVTYEALLTLRVTMPSHIKVIGEPGRPIRTLPIGD